MSEKVSYFLKNYLLNHSVQDGIRLYISQVLESKEYYTIRLLINEHKTRLIVGKTQKINGSKNKLSLINICSGENIQISCNYYQQHPPSKLNLVKSIDGNNVVSYEIKPSGTIQFFIGINIIDEVFNHLAAVNEFENEIAKKKQQPYCQTISPEDNEPIVDEYYLLFSNIINSAFRKIIGSAIFRKKNDNFNVCLTHDIDIIKKNHLSTLRYLSMLGYQYLSGKNNGVKNRIKKYLRNRSDFNQVTNIIDKEKEAGFNSTFFVHSKTDCLPFSRRFTTIGIDPLYRIGNNDQFVKIFQECMERGSEIGLHASYFAANNFEVLNSELKSLAIYSGHNILSNRNHFLNFSLQKTPDVLDKAGIKCDASFYYNNIGGFLRHKTCSPFYLFSHLAGKTLEVVEFPTVIMDSTLFNYQNHTAGAALEESILILDKVKKYRGIVCINWHAETATPEYGWHAIYDEILKWISKNNGKAEIMKNIYSAITMDNHGYGFFNT